MSQLYVHRLAIHAQYQDMVLKSKKATSGTCRRQIGTPRSAASARAWRFLSPTSHGNFRGEGNVLSHGCPCDTAMKI